MTLDVDAMSLYFTDVHIEYMTSQVYKDHSYVYQPQPGPPLLTNQ